MGLLFSKKNVLRSDLKESRDFFLSFFLSFFSKKKGSIKCGGSKDGKGTETNSGKSV